MQTELTRLQRASAMLEEEEHLVTMEDELDELRIRIRRRRTALLRNAKALYVEMARVDESAGPMRRKIAHLANGERVH
jgi:hypothetical protein